MRFKIVSEYWNSDIGKIDMAFMRAVGVIRPLTDSLCGENPLSASGQFDHKKHKAMRRFRDTKTLHGFRAYMRDLTRSASTPEGPNAVVEYAGRLVFEYTSANKRAGVSIERQYNMYALKCETEFPEKFGIERAVRSTFRSLDNIRIEGFSAYVFKYDEDEHRWVPMSTEELDELCYVSAY